ncbi:MAG: hypothetical protein KBT87_03735 [Gammaproteobacteria bacterium]|jgi:hypothetical protein|nr:hypothetical protein [Gammaproteobacteria bacterium]MBQ0773764.1 hypothetical protein [Gammaproteobacteria bacterium]|tara:strand:+ start:30362 stop:30676 length:315 start_codon:yes stop_codon:yes gene_type:complete
MEINLQQLFWMLFAAAALSSLMTLTILHIAFKYRIGPQIEEKVDRRLKSGAHLLEESIRQRFVDVLNGKSDVIRDRAKGFARTGISLLSGKRPIRDEYDDEGDF